MTAAASAAALADRLGYSYGMISNAVASYSGKWLSVPAGASTSQLPMTLEALAMAAPYVVAMLPDVFRAECEQLPPGATVLFVTGAITPSIPEQLQAIGERGSRILVLYAGDGQPPERIGDIPVTGMGHLLDSLPESESEYGDDMEFGISEALDGSLLER